MPVTNEIRESRFVDVRNSSPSELQPVSALSKFKLTLSKSKGSLHVPMPARCADTSRPNVIEKTMDATAI
eukprot:192779-Pleurochrysis_carterae.AAC.1